MMVTNRKQNSVMKRHGVICMGLVLLTLIVFEQVRHYGFVDYDDGAYIVKNEAVQKGLSAETVAWAFSKESIKPTANWHPLTWLSHLADISMFGSKPGAMHVENVVIHVTNVLLLFAVLVSATGNRWRSAFVAAVFSVHPLHVESVAWISERKDVLSTMFILVSVWSYVRWTKQRAIRWYLTSLLAFVLSLLAKQTYVTLPFLLLLLDVWPLARDGARQTDATVPSDRIPWQKLVTEKAVYFLITTTFCTVAFIGQRDGGAMGELEQYTVTERVYNAIIVYALYIKQTVWPLRLAVYYPYPREILFTDALASGLLLLAITCCAVLKRRTYPWIFTGWFWYLGTLVPVIGIVQIGSQRMADRYTYFPMIGLLIAGVWFVSEKLAAHPGRKTVLVRSAFVPVVALALMARIQTSYWKDTMTLFSHAAEAAESCLALTNIAHEYKEKGDFKKANLLTLRALALEPASMSARNMLGLLAMAENRWDAAEMYFRQTIHLHPRAPGPHYNLGLVLVELGRSDDAIEAYHQALRLEPDRRDIRTNLGVAYLTLGDNNKAMEQFEIVLDSSPGSPEANYNYAIALRNIGETERAVRHFQSVTISTPDMWYSHIHLAEIYLQKQQHGDALRHARTAVELSHGSPETTKLLRVIQEEH